ncbi:MAG: hypothetical protein JWO30_1239 [Fibrobacteres bacterium]|nr:hypothetical protein [Fibrobacterota bacterium]
MLMANGKAWMVLAGLVGGVVIRPAHAVLGMDAVHPAFEIAQVPLAAKYRTMGLAFLSDGRMVILTTGKIGGGEIPDPDPESAVYLVSGLDSPAPIAVKIADMFRQPSGVTVVNDRIFVSDRDAFYSIPSNSNSGDPAANRTKIVSWPMSGHWHQWVFTPVFKDGFFYAPYSGSIRQGGPSDVPATSDYSGAFLKWDPEAKTMEKVAGGLRSPNGAAMNDAGDIFVMDNQGSWLPGCAFMHMKPGRFYGHRQSPPQAPNWAEALPYQPPAVWIPYPSQVTGSATSQPIYMPKGPYAGQWLAGDANGPGLTRYALEKVNGEYQGTVFRFSNGTANSAVHRMAWGPDGSLYLGSLEHMGNWPGSGLMPLYRMTAKAGGSAFEMSTILSLKDGFEIVFTEPVDKASVSAAGFSVKQWHYTRGAAYGCCRDADEARSVSRTEVSDDGKRVYLQLSGLKAMDYVAAFKISGVKSAAGKTPWDNEAWYTLNTIADRSWDPHADQAAISPVRPAPAGWINASHAGAGILNVTVDIPGSWALTLRGLDGSLVSRLNGLGAGSHRISGGRSSIGVYVLEGRSAAGVLTRRVIF